MNRNNIPFMIYRFFYEILFPFQIHNLLTLFTGTKSRRKIEYLMI
jgi:hypothetical protein